VRKERRPALALYVVDWLPPDFGASDVCAALWARNGKYGYDVSLIGLTSGAQEKQIESFPSGVLEIKRSRQSAITKSGPLVGRLWSYELI